MNITGGSNLSLFEVQEAADIVASASDEDVNMIFGSVINDNLKDEIVVTVIATGFNEEQLSQPKPSRNPGFGATRQREPQTVQPSHTRREEPQQQQHFQQSEPARQQQSNQQEDALDIPTFLRNRRR